MTAWDVDLYMQFGDERTQPAIDLASRIKIFSPKRIIDIGCGPGNSTNILQKRWSQARITGLDSSGEMIDSARQEYPGLEWIKAKAESWTADEPYDIVFSNAAIQWIPNHDKLLHHFFDQVAPEGALAFQIPKEKDSLLSRIILDTARGGVWNQRMEGIINKGNLTIENPSTYYDILSTRASSIDIWETEYYHIMENPESIITWISSTGLRPFLSALTDDVEKERFLSLLSEHVSAAYTRQKNGMVLFPFRRLFVIAYR